MIQYTLENDIAILKMDDGKANVFSPSMSKDLSDKFTRAENEAKATVLIGRDGQFSAGFDLSVMQSGDAQAMITMVIAGFELLYQVAAHPQPVIAACTGNAMGLGAFLLLAADTRIAIDQQSKICLPETRAGMAFPAILVAAAKGRLNPANYIEATLQSQLYNPQSAIEAGFIDVLLPSSTFEQEVMATAVSLAQLPTHTYGNNKRDLLSAKLATMKKSLDEIKANPSILAA